MAPTSCWRCATQQRARRPRRASRLARRPCVERRGAGGQLSPNTTREQLLNPASYDGRQVYRNSKQANLLFAQELHRRCGTARSPVSAVAVHPGAAATNLFARQLDVAGHSLLARISKVITTVLLPSAAAGAQTTLRALDPSTPSGAFVGPAGLAQLRGRPELLDVYASAKDPATVARLRELTEQALGAPLPGLTVVNTALLIRARTLEHVVASRLRLPATRSLHVTVRLRCWWKPSPRRVRRLR